MLKFPLTLPLLNVRFPYAVSLLCERIVHRPLCDALKESSRQAGRVPAFRLAGLGGYKILAGIEGVYLASLRGLPPAWVLRAADIWR